MYNILICDDERDIVSALPGTRFFIQAETAGSSNVSSARQCQRLRRKQQSQP